MIFIYIAMGVIMFAIGFMPLLGRGDTVPVQKILKKLAEHFKGTVPFIRFVPHMKGFYRQHKFDLGYTFYGDLNMGDPSALHLRLFSDRMSAMRIYVYDKNPGTVLNAKRVITDDDSFDKEFWVYSNLLEEAKNYFRDAHHRTTIRSLYQNQWSGLYISGNKIKAATAAITPDVSPQIIEDALDKFLALQTGN